MCYCCREAAVAGTMHTNCLINQCDELEKEDEEEYHKVETGIASEGFVSWTIPEEVESKLDNDQCANRH